MRKVITISSILMALVGVIIQPAILNGLFGFLFAGIVPGTSITLPFWAMSCVLFMIGYSAVLWLKNDMLFIGDESHQENMRKQRARVYVMQKATSTVTVKKPVRIRQRFRRRQQTVTS